MHDADAGASGGSPCALQRTCSSPAANGCSMCHLSSESNQFRDSQDRRTCRACSAMGDSWAMRKPGILNAAELIVQA